MVSYRRFRREERRGHRLGARAVLLFFLALGLLGAGALAWPYRHPIVLGLLLAMACHPFQKRLEILTSDHKTAAAALSTLLLVMVVVVPAFLMTTAVISQGILSFQLIQGWIAGGGPGRIELWMAAFMDGMAEPWLEKIRFFYPGFDIEDLDIHGTLLTLVSSGLRFLVKQGGVVAGNLGVLVGHFFLLLLVFFVSIRNHDALLERFCHLFPLSGTQETRLFERMGLLVRSVFVGTFMTAMAQGAAGGLAFFAVGLPGIFWGAVMAFASLIPVVGTALVWVPAVIWLWATGSGMKALGLLMWCLLVVGSLDNFLRPLFMRGAAQMNGVVVFFAILGGLQLFGFLGLLYGPLIFGLASVFVYIYQVEFSGFLGYQNRH
ncbi:AI-2E family transporter [Desulfobotulus sp.]|jgi:predicted PurR-regulated permease PerM|uniref:AI-2E family transporter n=1 Tax=Desulfobotulus sp. TaxID=1940337 RepID=UPI002A35DCE6|nr:AI-2E family transporter [Desulfobotulus sp.]MDY0163955.1 AI-2E family transporter [Desulfobotulus sp.]